jgi:hypothetical protein
MISPRIPITSLMCAALAGVGCGTNDAGVANTSSALDRADPQAVARAYYNTFYDCGERGAGLRYDLSTSPERDWTRATYLRLEREDGCSDTTPPTVDPQLVDPDLDDEITRVVLRGHHILLPLILVRFDSGEWKVDTSNSPTPTRRSTP